MVPVPRLRLIVRGLCRRYVAEHGSDCLQPHRKTPIRAEHITAIVRLPEGTRLGRQLVCHTSIWWLSFVGAICTCAVGAGVTGPFAVCGAKHAHFAK